MFLNPDPNTAHFVSLIKHLSSLEETPGPKMCVSDKGDIHNVQCWGAQDQGWETVF